MWATCPLSDSSGYHAEFHEGYQKQTSSSLFASITRTFTVGAWQGRSMACVHQRGRETAWERHGICESVLITMCKQL
jgi:hypothetical protein